MKTISKKEKMYQQIQQHGENLNAIFNTGLDPVKLCKKLHTLESSAARLTLDECNTGKAHDVELCAILTKVKKVLFPDTSAADIDLYKAVFINGDPRGYTLKIKDEYVRAHQLKIHQDWGGYGIIAPTFDGNQ